MKTILTLIASLMILVSSTVAQQSYTTAPTCGTNQVLSTTGGQLALLSITAGATAVTVSFYDNGYGSTTYTNLAYTTRLSYPTNLTLLSTNREGIIATNIYATVLWTVSSTVASNETVVQIPALTATVPAGGVYQTTEKKVFSDGITLVTDTNCTINLQYWPLF